MTIPAKFNIQSLKQRFSIEVRKKVENQCFKLQYAKSLRAFLVECLLSPTLNFNI